MDFPQAFLLVMIDHPDRQSHRDKHPHHDRPELSCRWNGGKACRQQRGGRGVGNDKILCKHDPDSIMENMEVLLGRVNSEMDNISLYHLINKVICAT